MKKNIIKPTKKTTPLEGGIAEQNQTSSHNLVADALKYSLIIFILSKLVFAYEYSFLTSILKAEDTPVFNMLFAHWDSYWYLRIVNEGYNLSAFAPHAQASWNFWPMYPLLVKVITLFGANPIVGGIVLNQVLLFFSMGLLYLYIEKFANQSSAIIALIFLSMSFENIYFATMYTEALFLFASLGAFYYLKKGNYWLSAILCGILSATRFVGFMFIFVMLFNWYNNRQFNVSNLPKMILQLLIAVSGLLGYMIFLHYQIGDALGFYHIRKAWVNNNFPWFTNPIYSLTATLSTGNWYEYTAAIIVVVTAIVLIKNKMYEELIFIAFCILPVFAQGFIESLKRYAFDLFPLYIVLAQLGKNRQIIFSFMLIFLSVLNLALYFYWFTSSGIIN